MLATHLLRIDPMSTAVQCTEDVFVPE